MPAGCAPRSPTNAKELNAWPLPMKPPGSTS